jgi:hypothetical protein
MRSGGIKNMTKHAFGILVVSGLPGMAGILMAFFPRAIPRTINSYWAFFGMKSRLAESDYEKLGVRITGGVFVVFAIYVLIAGLGRP